MKINPQIKKDNLLDLLKQLAVKSLENAEELLNDSRLLLENNKFERAFFLCQIGVEEMGKHIICASGLVYALNDKLDIARFNQRFNNHLEKNSMLNFFEDVRFNNVDSIKGNDFNSQAKAHDRLKMMSLYSDFIEDYAYKPSECNFHQISNKAIEVLEKRVSWFKSLGIIEYLCKETSIIIKDIEAQQPYMDLIEKIKIKKWNNEDTTSEERELDIIDHKFYKIFKLTYDEVKIFDPKFSLSREEYEKYEMEG